MNHWVETAAGNLIAATAITHLAIRENSQESQWDVKITAAGVSTLFASGFNEAQAKLLRNQLAIQLGTPANGTTLLTSYESQLGAAVTSQMGQYPSAQGRGVQVSAHMN